MAVVYVRISKNRFHLKNVDSGAHAEIAPSPGFTTSRMLVGSFTIASAALKEGMAKVVGKGLFVRAPGVVIHPVEMIESGLSEIEERAIRELAIQGGVGKAVVWVGRELSDAEVKSKLSEK